MRRRKFTHPFLTYFLLFWAYHSSVIFMSCSPLFLCNLLGMYQDYSDLLHFVLSCATDATPFEVLVL